MNLPRRTCNAKTSQVDHCNARPRPQGPQGPQDLHRPDASQTRSSQAKSSRLGHVQPSQAKSSQAKPSPIRSTIRTTLGHQFLALSLDREPQADPISNPRWSHRQPHSSSSLKQQSPAAVSRSSLKQQSQEAVSSSSLKQKYKPPL